MQTESEAPTMITVREINDPAELGSVRLLWQSLHRQTPQGNFFQTLDWLEVYWRHYGEGQRLRVLVVSHAGEPIGILPLVVKREWTKAGPLKFLTCPMDDWGSFYGPLGPQPTATLTGALQHVRATRRDWDVLDMRWTDSDGVDSGRTRRVLAGMGLPAYETVRAETAIVNLDGTWEEYLAAKNSKWRNNYRRWHRRLEERGQVEYFRYRPEGAACGDGDPRWDLYEQCEAIAERSWQGSSQTGTTLSHNEVRPFLRDMHETAAKVGGVDMHLLYVNGEPAAFAYNYHFQGNIFGLRVGYDHDVAQEGIGNVLYCHALRDSFERGDQVYDFGPGSLDAKKPFLSEIRKVYRYSHYHSTSLRAQVLRVKRLVEGWRSDTAEVA